MSHIGLTKAKLLLLPTDDLRVAVEELDDYVDRLEKGGGSNNYATRGHVGIYAARLKAAKAELSARELVPLWKRLMSALRRIWR